MNAPIPPQCVTSPGEIFWTGLLIAITMAVHGFGMISMVGLLTFAWSTGVLFTLAQCFQDEQLQLLKNKREKQRLKSGRPLGSAAAPPK